MTGSPRSGSGSAGRARRTWPGCARRGTRWPTGTGSRMRRRSGSCWTAWTRGPWPVPCSGPAGVGPPAASVRGYHARLAARQAQELARGRLRAVAVDGKTSRGARRPDGTRVDLLGVAGHGGRLLDHLEADARHNETSHFTELAGTGGSRWRRGDLRCSPYRAGEPGLAGHREERALHRGRETQPAAAARPGHGPALAAGADRQGHPRERARPHRDPHPEGRPRRWSGLPACPPGPSTWPPSAPPSPRRSKTPATCTSPKAAATTPLRCPAETLRLHGLD